jgi:hypothetical protein
MTTSRNDSHSITPLASLRPIAKLVFGRALPAHGALRESFYGATGANPFKESYQTAGSGFDCRDGVPAADGSELFT